MHKALFHTEYQECLFQQLPLKKRSRKSVPISNFITKWQDTCVLSRLHESWALSASGHRAHCARRQTGRSATRGCCRCAVTSTESLTQSSLHSQQNKPMPVSQFLFFFCVCFFFHIYFSCDRRKICLKNIKLVQFEVEMFSLTLKQAGLMPGCFDVCLDQDSSTV